ncbi:MAG: hypothetical protein ACRERU_09180 [Methylococcales bacterium]
MLTQTPSEALKQYPGLGWISALGREKLRQLVEQPSLQLSWFDRQNLAEIHSPDFPGEGLIVCFNPMLAEERQRKRQALLKATEESLEQLVKQVQRRTRKPLSAAGIGRKVGQIMPRFKVAKHFETAIADGPFAVIDGEPQRSNARPNGMESMSFAAPHRNRACLPKTRCAVIKIWPGWNALFGPSKESIYQSGRSITVAKIEFEPAHLHLPIWSNGICVKPWRRCCWR